ncbi:MAG TPA: bifunctional DNA-binding transcriptional regulator/O6-methylguanine-DNA methyltransferase Ada [Thermoanaerobaculia bacterium]|nr:bifunctional DNA-binding transcriptional regulator/O6-methylguanine-DNA methyltransferase Ada [Thermoanaerobaculia bacterium]
MIEARMIDHDQAWAAVLARDAGRDGSFVYAVASTGIYCRPSCPSRRPRRPQVAFFPSPETAEAAGYRACRRCRPRDGAPAAAAAVARACAWIEAHPDEPVTLAALARAVGLSPAHLQRTFRRATGVTPKQFADARRLARLKTRLKKGDDVTTALYDAGYGSSSRLYERSDARLGMTPATYRRGGPGVRIRFACADSPVGRLLVAATERGLCAVMLGDDDDALEAGLRGEFPQAEVAADSEGLGATVAAVLASLDGGGPSPALPLDVRATAFEQRVWAALQEIPPGATRTYGEVAAALGRPGAARAVGRACAANPVALVVPCHRVVRGDGGLGGYRWGEERKRRLLAREGAAP